MGYQNNRGSACDMRPNEAADFSGCTNRSFFRTQTLLITSLQVVTIPHRPHAQKIASRGKAKKMVWLADRMPGLKIVHHWEHHKYPTIRYHKLPQARQRLSGPAIL